MTPADPDDSVPAELEPRPIGRAPRLRVLMIASEVSPWAKTGGLADVTGALPAALEALGHDVTTVMPRYRGMSEVGREIGTRRVVRSGLSHEVRICSLQLAPRRTLITLDVPELFNRDGLYGAGGGDYPDNADRFATLCTAALDLAEEASDLELPDIVHAHDWQAGLAPLLLEVDPARYRRLSQAGRVFTIHNLAYQGLFPAHVVPALGLPWDAFTMDTGEFWGKFSFLKAGITASDYITTVSPTYARETQTAAFGAGMEGVLSARADRYVGILNGIDTDVWNPETDPLLPAHFDAGRLEGKLACKRALLERFNLSVGDDALERPLIGMVSRLVEQKGLDLLEEAAGPLAALDATWVIVGTGEPRFETMLRAWAARYPTRIGVFIGFDEGLAHLVEAGADLFLMPSRFEPCGLNQMYSLRYGTVPVVHAVGGLDDTIQPYTARARHANGFKFREPTADALVRTLRQATRVYLDKPAWLRLVREGMAADHSWRNSAREYGKVYRKARVRAAARSGRR